MWFYMTAKERKMLLELEEKFGKDVVVNWRRLYGATADGNLITWMIFLVDGFTVAEIWND